MKVLEALGVPPDDAQLVADSLVTADMWGHTSHGMLRLPWYAARLRTGAMRAITQTEFVADFGAVATMDGHDGVGQVIADIACQSAVDRAQVHGVGVVAVRNSNHFGTAAFWTRRMTERGCIGILTTNSSPAMAPWGGTEKVVGSNPWSVASPGGSHPPVILDIANTSVARGKIYAAAKEARPIPDNWALGADGRPTTDPLVAIDGLLAPMGGHKGYAISFVMDVLSGVLSGSGYGAAVSGPYVPDKRSLCGHLVIALRIGALLSEEEFSSRIDDLISTTKSVPTAPGVSEIHYPGEIEALSEQKCREHGIRLASATLGDLRVLGRSCGIELDREVQWNV